MYYSGGSFHDLIPLISMTPSHIYKNPRVPWNEIYIICMYIKRRRLSSRANNSRVELLTGSPANQPAEISTASIACPARTL